MPDNKTVLGLGRCVLETAVMVDKGLVESRLTLGGPHPVDIKSHNITNIMIQI